jgi:PAS domain S-box-containing protein
MRGTRRPGLVLASALLTILLLAGEFWLLQDSAERRTATRDTLWAHSGLNSLHVRLQAALDYADLLTLAQSAQPLQPVSDRLSIISSSALAATSPFNGIALIQSVTPDARRGFENRFNTPIRTLEQHHLVISPKREHYYPVIDYLPDNASGLTRGLDLSILPGWEWAFNRSLTSSRPALVASSDESEAGGRLGIIVPAETGEQFLLFNLDRARLVKLSLPDGENFLQRYRLIAWFRRGNRPQALLFDSRSDLPSPGISPVASLSIHPGGMDIMLGAYRLDPAPPQLDTHELLILLFSALAGLVGIGLLAWQQQQKNRLDQALAHVNKELEHSASALHYQMAERVASELARTESEMRQRAILQASTDAFLLLDHHGTISDANPSAARLIGQSAESLAGLPAGALFPVLYDSRQPHFEAIAANYEGMPFESQLVRNDDSKIPVELSLSLVSLPDDLFYLVVCRDISLRKEQEAALIRLKNSLAEQVEMQSRQLSALLDASPLAMAYIVDRHLKQVNGAFLELFDCDEGSAINFTTRQFYQSDEQFERTGRLLYHLLNEGKVVTTELQLQTGHGQLLWCRLHGKALNPAVPGLGTIWVYQDFSAERAAENALRTAKELAEETSRTKTEFLANMSHELRTPMHAILGFAEMGQNRAIQPGQEKLQQYFNRILSSGNRLLSLLNDLLDLAKMEVGRMEYHLSDDDLAQTLHEVCDELSALAESSGVRIELHSEPTPLIATFDNVRIGQVIRNLLTNAIKFSPRDGVIRIEASVQRGVAHPVVRVTVTDQGPGIPVSELESIFDKFIQSSGTKTGAGGTGLGLAICREIMHAHQGEIRAENAAAGGAVFSFTFPVRPRTLI